MKLCLISPVPPPYGGIANWTKLILPELAQREVTVFLINIAPTKRSTEGRNLFDRVFGSGFAMLKHCKSLRHQIRSDRPDAIHITTSGRLAIIRDILLLKIAQKNRIPAYYHIRFGRIPELCEKQNSEWRLLRKAVRLAATTVAIDEATYYCLKKQYPESRSVLIPNPVRLSAIPKSPENRKKELLFVGWVVREKGIEELLQSWQSCCASFPDYTLRIIGPGQAAYLAELKNRYPTERVRFDGEIDHDEVLRLMSQAEAFLLPSYSEGFPNAVVEAMGAGMKIAASAVGAIPEMLSDGCGILMQPGDADSCAAAIRQVISADPVMGQNAKQKANAAYSLDVITDAYLRLWSGERLERTVV